MCGESCPGSVVGLGMRRMTCFVKRSRMAGITVVKIYHFSHIKRSPGKADAIRGRCASMFTTKNNLVGLRRIEARRSSVPRHQQGGAASTDRQVLTRRGANDRGHQPCG